MLSGSHASSLSWAPARTRTRAPLDRRGHIGKRARCLWIAPFHCHLSPPPPLNLALRLSVSLERLGCPEGRPPQSPFLGVPSRTRDLLEVLAKPGSGTSVPSLDAQNSEKTPLGGEGVDGRPLLTGKWPRSVTSLSLQPPGPAMASKGNQSGRLGQAPSRESEVEAYRSPTKRGEGRGPGKGTGNQGWRRGRKRRGKWRATSEEWREAGV